MWKCYGNETKIFNLQLIACMIESINKGIESAKNFDFLMLRQLLSKKPGLGIFKMWSTKNVVILFREYL